MYTTITSIDAPAQVDNHLSVVQNQQSFSVFEILKEYSLRFDHALSEKVRVPLGHISLAIELLESLKEDKDLKMCLEVITRNSTRINNLVNEFNTFQQIEEWKAKRYSVKPLHKKVCLK